MTNGEAVLDGISDVPWAVRKSRTYALTRDVDLSRLTICEGVTVINGGPRFMLNAGEIVNYGTIIGTFGQLGELRNEGYIDPAAMRRFQ